MDRDNDNKSGTPQAAACVLKAVRLVVGTLLLAGLALNVANVAGRYIVHKPIIAAEELLGFGMVWCIFLGAVLVTWDGRHLRMDILYFAVPDPVKRVLNGIVLVIFVVIGSILVVTSGQIVALVGRLSEVSVVAQVPMTVPWAAIPVSFALMVCLVLLRARAVLSGRQDDTARVDEIPVENETPADADRS